MRVTSKGQVTIPVAIRRKYGIAADVEVEWVETDDGPMIRVECETREQRARRIVKKIVGTAIPGVTTDQIMALTRNADS